MSNDYAKTMEEWDVVRREFDVVHVLGRSGRMMHHYICSYDTGEVIKDDSFRAPYSKRTITKHWPEKSFPDRPFNSFARNKKRFREHIDMISVLETENVDDLKARANRIPIYLSWEAAERDLGKLGVCETRTSDRYIEAANKIGLRVRALELKADAILDIGSGSSGQGLLEATPARKIKPAAAGPPNVPESRACGTAQRPEQ